MIELKKYLKPAYYIDSDSIDVINLAKSIVVKKKSDIEAAIDLYYAIRDSIKYNPYEFNLVSDNLKASIIAKKQINFCIPKAVLLASVARVIGIPSRLGFADVKNHLISKELFELMQTNVFIYHGFAELYLNNKWVKATPAFDKAMCEKNGIKTPEFDGHNDSIFHEYDTSGKRHMEYLKYHGSFDDLPYDQIVESMKKNYPLHILYDFKKNSD